VKDTAKPGLAVSRCTLTRRIEFNKNYARPARDLALVTYAICSSCAHNKTAKNRFAPSFFGHSGPAKAARRGAGLDQIGSSRHG
jgi:hypothetical protein